MPRILIAIVALLLGGIALAFGISRIPSSHVILTPDARIASAAKGTLKNPYTDYESVAADGHKLFKQFRCTGCHGMQGQGRVCPSLKDGVWVFDGRDDTLFRLITVGSGGMLGQGFKATHPVAIGAMPPFGGIIPSDKDIWKIISWIRTIQPAASKQK